DTERAVEILTRYQSTLQSPEEQELKASIGKVSHVFQSELFQALLGKPLPHSPCGLVVSGVSLGPDPAQVPGTNQTECIPGQTHGMFPTGAGDSAPGTPPRLVRVTARRTEAPASVCSLVLSSHSNLPQVSL
ncbi:DLG1 protein, partial [Smithornis capensis]|nr:DLG1 protein [Smithornis capensis]